jgi:tetrahydromethanopterin S-methyltransferase subunit G
VTDTAHSHARYIVPDEFWRLTLEKIRTNEYFTWGKLFTGIGDLIGKYIGITL